MDEKKMPKKGKKISPKGYVAPESDIVQKVPGNYDSRYGKDYVAPKDKVVDQQVKQTYDSRYN